MAIVDAVFRAADRLAEPAGSVVGALAAPLTWVGARLRGDRLFHARGVVYDGVVTPIAGSGAAAALADRLAGPALVRFSNAFWRDREWPDVLGVAVRFRMGEAPHQDLILATVRRPWTFPWAIATTRWRDFLQNDYFVVAPYEADAMGTVELRLRGETGGSEAPDRELRLRSAAERGAAVLRLDVRTLPGGTWTPLVSIAVGRPRHDARAVRFHPFHDAAGLHPRGFVHAMRRAVYAASRMAAPVPARSRP